jgi:hypothetical protein
VTGTGRWWERACVNAEFATELYAEVGLENLFGQPTLAAKRRLCRAFMQRDGP